MVHADEHVAGLGQLADGQRENLQLGVGRRQVGLGDPALRLEQAGQVGVVVDRQAVRIHRQHALQRPVEAHHRLVRQAVDQVDRDRLESVGARIADHVEGFFLALDAVDRDLDALVEVLDPDAHPVEAQFAEQRDRRRVDLARVDLDRILAAVEQLEVLSRLAHQLAHLVVRQEGRRTAAPVQLGHLVLAVDTLQAARLKRQFLGQVFQVFGAAPVILGDDLVTGAVIADGVAERDVEV